MEKESLASPKGKLQCFLPGGWKENHAASMYIILIVIEQILILLSSFALPVDPNPLLKFSPLMLNMPIGRLLPKPMH